MEMDKLQLSWIFIGLIFGLITISPINRCLATQNGLISMLTASLMGIFHIWFSWVAVVIALVNKTHQPFIPAGTEPCAQRVCPAGKKGCEVESLIL